MKFKVEFWGQEKYLPNRRCRKLRSRTIKGTTFVIVREVKMTEFPLVFQHPVSTGRSLRNAFNIARSTVSCMCV